MRVALACGRGAQFEHDDDAPACIDDEPGVRRSSSIDVARWDDDTPDSALKIYDRDRMNARLADMIEEVRRVLEVCVCARCVHTASSDRQNSVPLPSHEIQLATEKCD